MDEQPKKRRRIVRVEHDTFLARRLAFGAADRVEERRGEIATAEMEHKKQKAELLQEAENWANQHGSSRLKKIVEEGFLPTSLPVYREERLALARPGWQYLRRLLGRKGHLVDPVNPTEAVIDWLRAGRAETPSACLMFAKAKDRSREEHCFVLASEFLGLPIVLVYEAADE